MVHDKDSSSWLDLVKPKPNKLNLWLILLSLIGMIIGQVIENEQRHHKHYWEQWIQSSPSTYVAVLGSMIISLLFFVEWIVTVPMIRSLTILMVPFGLYSEASAICLLINSFYMAQGFGMGAIAIITVASHLLGPICSHYYFSSVMEMAGVEFYQRTVFLVLCQVVCLILAIFTPQTVDLEKMMDRVVPELDLKYDYLLRSTVFIYLVQFLGWSTYMFDSYVRQAIEKSYHSGEACLLVVPRSFKCQVGRITHVLQQWVDSEAFIREAIILTKVTVTAKGKGIAQYGSPEFCLFQRIQRGDDVNAEDYKEEEAVKYALQNKWIRRVTRYGVSELKLGNKAPQKDEVKEIICQLLENKSLSNAGKSKKKIPQGWIAELTKRNIVKLEVSASGDLSEFRHGYSVEFKL